MNDYRPGITKRLLEKYKPNIKVLHLDSPEKNDKKRAA